MNLDELMGAHADRIDGTPITLGEVKARARIVKRRRAATAASAGVAAVIALVVPIAVLSGGPDEDTQPQPVRDPLSTVAPQDPLDMTIAAAAPGGAEPANAWLDGSTLHRLDGSSVEVAESYRKIYVVGGDVYLGVRRDAVTDLGMTLDEIGSKGEAVSSRTIISTTTVALSADKTVAAYTTPEGDVRVWDDRGESTLATTGQGQDTGNAVAVTGSESCDDGCSVTVNPYGPESGEPVVYSTQDPDGVPLANGFNYVYGVSPDGRLLSGTRTPGEPGADVGCIEIWDTTEAKMLHRCKSGGTNFSPDSSHTGEPAAYRDGEAAWIEIRDARTGVLRVKIGGVGDSDNSQIEPVIWEDDTHYLVNALSDGKWTLLRGDLDGRLQVIAGPVDLPNPEQPYESPYAIAP